METFNGGREDSEDEDMLSCYFASAAMNSDTNSNRGYIWIWLYIVQKHAEAIEWLGQRNWEKAMDSIQSDCMILLVFH